MIAWAMNKKRADATQSHLLPGESISRENQKASTAKLTPEQINEKYAKGEIRIVTEQARYPLPSIPGMVASDSYILNPEFQRRHRWSVIQKSRLIESIVINVPIPPIFIYEIEYSTFEVMDGLQRLTAISDFYNDKFALEGLEEWNELNGFKYSTLPSNIKRGIDRRYLSSIVLLQETAKTKEEEDNLKQLVFNRINSGGVDLTPQESRNALLDGRFNKICIKLSKNSDFKKLYRIADDDSPIYRSMRDVELVLRFFANRQRDNFGGSLESYLDFYLKEANKFTPDTIKALEGIFNSSISLCIKTFGEDALIIFRPRKYSDKEVWSWSDQPSDLVYDSLLYVLSTLLDRKDEILSVADTLKEGLEEFYRDNEAIFGGRNVNNSDRIARQMAFKTYILKILDADK